VKYVFYVNVNDEEGIMSDEFMAEMASFFEKDDTILRIPTVTGATRLETLPFAEKKSCCNPAPRKRTKLINGEQH
jgi:hypothetical protein